MYIDVRLFTWLFISFIFATIVGTLTHELGHYVVAECLGYDATIHYGSMSINHSNQPSETHPHDNFWITFGGPFQTILTGSIGLCLLLIFRKTFKAVSKLFFWQWLLIFTSLFWLRQPANFSLWILSYIVKGKISLGLDEIVLALDLNFPIWSIVSSTALIGFLVLYVVIFKFIPRQQRLIFIFAGLLGGIAGFTLWLNIVGKILIP